MQSFQAAPPSQQHPHPDPFSPKPSLLEKIKAHKTPVIMASIGFLLLSSMLTYLVVSPSQDTLVAPANQEPIAPPPAKRTPTPKTAKLTPTVTPVPTLASTNWRTYNNSAYNYSIKYPPGWTARNLGVLEPLIPSYVVFNPQSASQSARFITISISTRSYEAQLALGASGSATTVGGITGTRQSFQDSDGNTSTVITLPRTGNLLVLRVKTAYLSVFNQMITTLQTTR